MANLNPIYRRSILDENYIKVERVVRGKFYMIKDYNYSDGSRGSYQETNAPIIYTLYVSKLKDIMHVVKVTDIKPHIVKRFFGKFVNEDSKIFEMKGSAKQIYNKIVSKMPAITSDAYRTYKLSGIKKIMELDMEMNELIPRNMEVKEISKKYQKKNM